MKILTGDRPTGCLHLGHYVGSLENRLAMQKDHEQHILIADLQALTDNFDKTDRLEDNIYKIFSCYLAVGLNPKKNIFFLQSSIPELSELTMYFMNLVTLERVKRNPTIKEEIKQKGMNKNLPLGFLTYPVSQAADILLFHGEGVPVGVDQLPMIEQTNDIVKTFNHVYNTSYFSPCKAILSKTNKLIGLDGKNKMSKSLKNGIFFEDNSKLVYESVMKMYTDPDHIKISDPGKVEGNVVFTYLDIFDPEKEELESLKKQYKKGGLGDIPLKKRLYSLLEEFISPIREKYYYFYNDKKMIQEALFESNKKAKKIANENITKIKEIMKIPHL